MKAWEVIQSRLPSEFHVLQLLVVDVFFFFSNQIYKNDDNNDNNCDNINKNN